MKIIFDKIITNKDTLKISLDNGVTSVEKPVSELLSNGYNFSEYDCLDLNNIQLGNKSVKKPSFTAEQNNVFKELVFHRWRVVRGEDLNAYLESLPDNTPDTPYRIQVTSNYSFSSSSSMPANKYFELQPINCNVSMRCPNIVKLISYSDAKFSNGQFCDCENLKEVTLGVSIQEISYGGLPSALKVINYVGTEEQWNAVNKTAWNISPDCVINYNYRG